MTQYRMKRTGRYCQITDMSLKGYRLTFCKGDAVITTGAAVGMYRMVLTKYSL